MGNSIKSPKILVFYKLCGYLDLLKQIIEIGKMENVQYIVSLGDCFGYHDNINECIDLGEKCILLKGNWETCLESEKDIFVTNIRLSKLVFDKSKSQLKEDKFNIGIPLTRFDLPTVMNVNQELIEAEINNVYRIADYMNQIIFPGCLYNTARPDGIGYYCVIDGETFVFRKIEYFIWI